MTSTVELRDIKTSTREDTVLRIEIAHPRTRNAGGLCVLGRAGEGTGECPARGWSVIPTPVPVRFWLFPIAGWRSTGELTSAASSSDELSDRVELDVIGEPLSRLFIDGFMWNRQGDPHDAAGWVEKKFAEMAASVDDDSVISNLKPAEAEGKPIGGHDATSAYAVYEYQYLGSQLAAYYDCRELLPGVAGLCSWFVTPRDQFNSQVPHVREVLDTLTAATVNPCSLLPAGTPSLNDPRAAATPTPASGCEATELVDPHVVATPLASGGDALFMHYARSDIPQG